jgi:hypothetical protein
LKGVPPAGVRCFPGAFRPLPLGHLGGPRFPAFQSTASAKVNGYRVFAFIWEPVSVQSARSPDRLGQLAQFAAKNDGTARRSPAISLAKNTMTFHRFPT